MNKLNREMHTFSGPLLVFEQLCLFNTSDGSKVVETFILSKDRLIKMSDDWDTILVLASTLLTVRQFYGEQLSEEKLGQVADQLKRAMSELAWTCQDILHEVSRILASFSVKPLADDQQLLFADLLVGRCHPFDSVREVLDTRLRSSIASTLEDKPLTEAAMIKQGLGYVSFEIEKLTQQIHMLGTHHWKVHHKLYNILLRSINDAK